MTWQSERCSKHPASEIVPCCEECVDVFCEGCGAPPNAVATFADSDEDGLTPLEVVVR